MIYLACTVLGFIAGGLLTALYYNDQAKKAARRRDEQRRAQQERLRRSQRAGELPQAPEEKPDKPVLSKPQKTAQESPAAGMKKQAAAVRQIHAAHVHDLPPETDEERLRRIYRGFDSLGSLELKFQYSFPDSVLFQPGEGYLRGMNNQLMPEEKVITSTNSTVGYAMVGLFRVYDVIYQGKEYTFREIMDGEMGDFYVQIHAVKAPAIIAETGHYGSYKLVKTGKIEVIDFQ